MGGKNAPDPPDYRGAAEEQAAASAEIANRQTWANRPTQTTPWGTTTWDAQSRFDPSTGQTVAEWTQNVELTPELQEALDAQLGLQSGRSNLALGLLDRAEEEFSGPVSFDDYEALRSSPDAQNLSPESLQRGLDFSGASEVGDPLALRARAEDAAYGSMTSRLDPMFEDRQADLDLQLRGQGLRPGDEAYDRAMRNETFARNDAYAQAMRGAIDIGRGEASQLFDQDISRRRQDIGEITTQGGFFNDAARSAFGMQQTAGGQNFQQGMSGAAFDNQLRQQQIAEEMQRRGYSLNEINAIITGQQVQNPNMPSFMGASAGETPQYLAAANMGYQAELDSFNSQQAALQGMLSGVSSAGLGAAGLFV